MTGESLETQSLVLPMIPDMQGRPWSILPLCSGPALSSRITCEHALYPQQRAKFLLSYPPQIMSYNTVRQVHDSYRVRVGPGIDLAVESYLPCDYTPSYKTSIGPRPRPAAIIFLHDFGLSSYIFKRIIDGCRCHCITVDFRGCGESSLAQVSRFYSVERMVADIENLLPKLENVTDFVIAGHGMGAKIAQIVASDEPEGLIGLALISPVPASPWILSRSKMERLYGSCESTIEALDFANSVLSARPGSLSVSDLDTISVHATRQDRALTIAWLREGSEGKEGDWSEVFEEIEVPSMAITGISDRLINVQTVKKEVYEKIHGCIMVEVEDAGHLLPLERPKKLLEELQAFFDACVDVRKHNGLRSGSLLYQGFCMAREADPSKFMRTQGLE